MVERADALIIPADNFANDAALKKMVLFFDSVTLVNSSDSALVNEFEVREKFEGMEVAWSARNPFPRSESFSDEMQRLLSETLSFQSRRIIRLTPATPMSSLDAGMNYSLWHSAIANKDLVTAAAPDRFTNPKPTLGISGYMRGGTISVGNARSKYEITETKPSVVLENVDEDWTLYAHLRLGRALKFLRQSHALGLSPIALDLPNQQILKASSEFDTLIVRNQSETPAVLHNQVNFDFDIFEPEEFNNHLNDMTWSDVQQLRRHVLPGMNGLRTYLRRSIRLKGLASTAGVEAYNKELVKLLSEYRVAKEKLTTDWEKLRVGTVTKIGAGVGAGVGLGAVGASTGLIGTIVGAPWVDLLVTIFASGLIGAGHLTSELQNLIPARRVVKQHPLYFTDNFFKGS